MIFSRVFAVRFRARLIERANLKHLFPSRSPKPNKFYVSLKLVANWDGFSMKIFSLNHTSAFLCKTSSPHTWTKTPLNIGILAAPLGRFYLFILKVWRFGLGFSLKEWGGWYGDMLLTCQPCFCVLGNSGQWSTWLVHKLWADGNGVIVNIRVVFLFVMWLCQKVIWAFQYGALWSVISGGVSRNSRWFQELYILYKLWTYFLVEKKTQFSLIKSKVSWAWCHWSQQ